MIYTEKFASWSDFEESMNKRKSDPLIRMNGPSYIFRGQSDASWTLKSSLERSVGLNLPMGDYYLMIEKIRPQIETFTNQTWNTPDYEEYLDWFKKLGYSMYDIPAFEYMAYLRHHGYPSPLIDWSYSPYIAAYFAFRDISSKAEFVAIFEYYTQFGLDAKLLDDPKIFRLEKDIKTHKRHYLQQSVYTI